MQANSGGLQKWLLRGLALAGFGYVTFLLLARPLSVNLDGAMYMEGASRLMAGGLPYIDFVDINPPLAYYLHSLPVLLSNLTGLLLTNAFVALILLATLASSLVSYRLLTMHGNAQPVRAAILSLAPVLLLIPLEANFDLGQRAHLFALAALPFVITRLLRAQGDSTPRLTAVAIGLFVGIATCLKPFHYAAMLAGVELFLLISHRRYTSLIAPEIIGAIAAVAGYGLVLLLLPAASSEAFFGLYLPLILDSYAAYGMPSGNLFHKAGEYILEPLILAVTCAALMRTDRDQRYGNLAMAGALIAVTGAALFLIQGKGWAYHAIPIWFGGYIAVTCLVGRVAAARPNAWFTRFVALTPLLIILGFSALVMSYATKEAASAGKKKVKDYVSDVIREHSDEGETVYIMSPSVDAAYPLLPLLNRQQATRFPFLFLIPMLYADSEPDTTLDHGHRITAERRPLEQDFLSTLNTELTTEQPPLILVERWEPCLFCPADMTLPAYIEAHADELSVFSQYEHTGWTRRFKILVRKDRSE